MKAIELLNRLLKEYVGIGVLVVLGLIIFLAAGGAAGGLMFPKYEATALLQFPEKENPSESGDAVELSDFKRVSASYATSSQLKRFVDGYELQNAAAAYRLLLQGKSVAFWDKSVHPVLPFTKNDQREYGDIGRTAATRLLGLELTANARTEQLAVDMVDILAEYFTNAMMRERIRTWVLAEKTDAVGTAKSTQADILRAEWDIQLLERRVMDMKGILTRYPEAAHMDARPVVNVNAAQGGDRFLSPLAQLVGFESTISERREQIRRWERNLKQNRMLATFFTEAEPLVDATVSVEKLLLALQQLVTDSSAAVDSEREGVKETTLRVNGVLDNFSEMLSQFSVRHGIRVGEVANRSPVRLAFVLALLGIVVIGGIVFVRASLRAADKDDTIY